jgi:8-oxo-dGTP pyrophosphatase MutT (NUDIX family)
VRDPSRTAGRLRGRSAPDRRSRLDGGDIRGRGQTAVQLNRILRRAARVVVLDPAGAVLLQLIRSSDGGEWWITPGGALENDETAEEAAVRELVEEIGLHEAQLGPAIWTRQHAFDWEGQPYDQRETFFVCELSDRFEAAPTVSAEQLRAEGIVEHRWWTIEEIEASPLEFAPRKLASLLRALRTDGPPAEPIDAGV